MIEKWDDFLSNDGAWVQRYDPMDGLRFCHVPRTGGSSLNQMLHDVVPPDRFVVGIEDPLCPGEITGNHYNRAFGAGVEDVDPATVQFFTMLRDPFDRMVSWYFYMKNVCPERSMQLSPFGDTIFLAAYGSTLGDFLMTCPLGAANFLPRSTSVQGILSDFVFVGETTRMRPAINFITYMLGVHAPSVIMHTNSCIIKDESVTDEMRTDFRARRKEEYELYDFAVRRWTPVWDVFESE